MKRNGRWAWARFAVDDDYDSRPEGRPSDPDPSNNDYGITNGVGWSW